MSALISYFKLDFGLRNVLLTSAPPSYLLSFSNLRSDCLETKSVSVWYKADGAPKITYVRAEIFQGKPFHGVDAELRAWLHNGEPSGHYHDSMCQCSLLDLIIILVDFLGMQVSIRQSSFKLPLAYSQKNCLLPPLSSIISTSPGFNCSIEGTWFASTPISPDSAGILTCTLSVDFGQLKTGEIDFQMSYGGW